MSRKLTHNVDEQRVSSLLSATAIFKIPYFQRSYKWKNEEFKQFFSDLDSIVDGIEDVHFLGALITFQSYSPTGQPSVIEIVDGQQRLATTTVAFAALAKEYSRVGKPDVAANIFATMLYLPQPGVTHPSNLKFYPSKGDRAQYKRIIEDLLESKDVKDNLGSASIRYLPSSGSNEGLLWQQYKRLSNKFKNISDNSGVDKLDDYYDSLSNALTIVQIGLQDPTNSSQIFERLNYRGQRVSTGDLIRNEIFSRIAGSDPHEIDNIHDNHWEPFYGAFADEKGFEAYFFPYGLIVDPNVKKAEVFGNLQEDWRNRSLSPDQIITELEEYQEYFIDLYYGHTTSNLSEDVKLNINSLFKMNAPSSIYPFVLRLCKDIDDGRTNEDAGIFILHQIESFLVRRAVLGVEPTGLHAVFKKLWNEIPSPNELFKGKESIIAFISRHNTVTTVDDLQFKNGLIKRSLYGTNIIKYILTEYDKSLGGDCPGFEFEIEHVLPRTANSHWKHIFDARAHDEYKDTLANLIPITRGMNASLGGAPYEKKREIYHQDSMFKSPRYLSTKYETWDIESLNERGETMARWALNRWPY